jgi:hypothetical protein
MPEQASLAAPRGGPSPRRVRTTHPVERSVPDRRCPPTSSSAGRRPSAISGNVPGTYYRVVYRVVD